MPAATVDIGTLITRSPEIRGGRPRITGTGVTVQRIAGWYKLGLSPEEIVGKYGHLTLAQVHAVLAYFHTNRAKALKATRIDRTDADHLDHATWDEYLCAGAPDRAC